MKLFNLLIAASFIILASCNNNNSKEPIQQDHQKTEIKSEEASDAHEHDEKTESLKLDDGKKWKANPETLTGINNMINLVQDGLANKMSAATLKGSLQSEFKTIFDKCTMTGEAHEQLHHFLVPLKGLLEKINTNAENTAVLTEIKTYLDTFKNYFE
ncbi:MAG: hypothetical protein IPL97_04430 [Niastella sp.]|nr:hypothetical protein [Niastella sp.]